MNDTVEITIWVCTNKVRSEATMTVTFDREEWEEMSEEEREEVMREEYENSCLVEWGWREE